MLISLVLILSDAAWICGSNPSYRCLVSTSACLREGFLLHGKDNQMVVENCAEQAIDVHDLQQSKYHSDAYIICGKPASKYCLKFNTRCLRDALAEGNEPDEAFEYCDNEWLDIKEKK